MSSRHLVGKTSHMQHLHSHEKKIPGTSYSASDLLVPIVCAYTFQAIYAFSCVRACFDDDDDDNDDDDDDDADDDDDDGDDDDYDDDDDDDDEFS